MFGNQNVDSTLLLMNQAAPRPRSSPVERLAPRSQRPGGEHQPPQRRYERYAIGNTAEYRVVGRPQDGVRFTKGIIQGGSRAGALQHVHGTPSRAILPADGQRPGGPSCTNPTRTRSTAASRSSIPIAQYIGAARPVDDAPNRSGLGGH